VLVPAAVNAGEVPGYFRTAEDQPVEAQHDNQQDEHFHGVSPFFCHCWLSAAVFFIHPTSRKSTGFFKTALPEQGFAKGTASG